MSYCKPDDVYSDSTGLSSYVTEIKLTRGFCIESRCSWDNGVFESLSSLLQLQSVTQIQVLSSANATIDVAHASN